MVEILTFLKCIRMNASRNSVEQLLKTTLQLKFQYIFFGIVELVSICLNLGIVKLGIVRLVSICLNHGIVKLGININMIIAAILVLRFLVKLRFPTNTPISTILQRRNVSNV